MATELLKELSGGAANFTMIGAAKVDNDTFAGEQSKENSHWHSVNSTLAIDAGEGLTYYPRINDGYMNNNPVIKRPKADRDNFGMIEIPFKDRLNEIYTSKVAEYAKFRTNVVLGEEGKTTILRDAEGKPTTATFLHGIDFEEYLKANLVDGTPVRIQGNTKYSFSKDLEKVYKNYEIKSVFLNEGYERNGEHVDPLPNSATMTQTYLIDPDSLSKKWEKELELEGVTTVDAFVSEYISKLPVNGEYVEFKKRAALPQQILIKADIADEKSVRRAKLMAERLFKLGKRDGVRELTLIINIHEGYETATGEIEMDAELREMVELGMMSEEDISSQITIRGNRVSELILIKPRVTVDRDTNKSSIDITDNKYEDSVLAMPVVDSAEDDFTVEDENLSDDSAGMGDKEFDDLFAN